MFGRLLDRVFGKRYRKGWPRGVRPIFGEAFQRMQEVDPDLWEMTRSMPAGMAFAPWWDKHPLLMRGLFPREAANRDAA